MARLRSVLASCVALTFATAATAAEPMPCGNAAKIVAACFAVHGRISLSNGNPSVRMWRVGTTRMLGVVNSNDVTDEDQDYLITPKALAAFQKATGEEFFREGYSIFGDYTVCPLSPERPGWMQYVCIKDASNLVIRNDICTSTPHITSCSNR